MIVHEPASTAVQIADLDKELLRRFAGKFILDPTLTRPLVSYQASKTRAGDRWFKFKEAFSAELVQLLLQRYGITSGKLLDPFSGSGTALFAAASLGLDADGIDMLPIGQEIITSRLIGRGLADEELAAIERWGRDRPWRSGGCQLPLPNLRITAGAYPQDTQDDIQRYLGALQSEDPRIRQMLRFTLLCVLESVSYTRKDGQYLRWDVRCGRTDRVRSFDKGPILSFEPAVTRKLQEVLADVRAAGWRTASPDSHGERGAVRLLRGSCLNVLPTLPAATYNIIFTSPPYCNRYDYTRTYALELAMLGIGEQQLSDLRQQMLTCTVENRAKDLIGLNPGWSIAVEAADHQELLQLVLDYLDRQKIEGLLNNNGIPRMVRGYFYEMACVVQECARVLKPDGLLFMVNDNVRYAGASVSVDLILSEMAERLGFRTDSILVLPNGKGNSSQQMGSHGREPLRKCVYVWRKG